MLTIWKGICEIPVPTAFTVQGVFSRSESFELVSTILKGLVSSAQVLGLTLTVRVVPTLLDGLVPRF